MKIGVMTWWRNPNYGGFLLGLALQTFLKKSGYDVEMVKYLVFPKFYTVCRELSWSHYRTLMRVENPDARQYYLDECVKSGWSVRVLQRTVSRCKC